jgi:DNA-binding SARP family transcriptional activator
MGEPLRETLRQEYLDALRTAASLAERRGDQERAVGFCRRFLQSEPTEESAHRQLMRWYAEMGRRHAALRQYRICVEALKQGLDAESRSRPLGSFTGRSLRGDRAYGSQYPLPRPPSRSPRSFRP